MLIGVNVIRNTKFYKKCEFKLYPSGLSFQKDFCLKKQENPKRTGLFFVFLFVSLLSVCSFGDEEEKVLDLGEIEITGEVRRPNINLIYSKKYIDKAVNIIVRDELKKLEKDLLQPDATIGRQFRKKKKRS